MRPANQKRHFYSAVDGVDGTTSTASKCQDVVAGTPQRGRPSMKEFIRIGVDLAKNYFQIHALESEDGHAATRKLSRQAMRKLFSETRPCLVGMEACGSAHYWARELRAMGHEVRLIPPIYVKPYVKRGKNDAADAASSVIDHLIRVWNARIIGAIDPEEFYDFQVARPHVELVDGLTRKVTWPANEFWAARLEGAERDALVERRRHQLPLLVADRPHRVAADGHHHIDDLLAHRGAVNAAARGDQHVWLERRTAQEMIDAGPQRLDPLQPRRAGEHEIPHLDAEHEHHVDVGKLAGDGGHRSRLSTMRHA